jgi:hypothetical protein
MPASEAANEEGQTLRNMMIFAAETGAHANSTAPTPAQHPLLTMPAAAAGASVLSATAVDSRGAKVPILRIGLEKSAPPPRTAADAAASDQKALDERIQALEPSATDISQLSFLVRCFACYSAACLFCKN